jgi:MFS family permease
MTVRLKTPELSANIRHLYGDIFWFGVLSGSTLAFLAIYATRLGASGFQISLLTAGPAVVNLLVSIPFGRWLEGRPLVKPTFWSAALNRLGYLALILLPWLFGAHLEVWAIVLITLVMSVPGALLAIGFNALLADVIPPDWRAEVIGRRNALMAVSLTVTALVSGQLLVRIVFPINYQIVFTLGAIGAVFSTYHLGRLRLAGQPVSVRIGRPLRDFALPGLLRTGNLNQPFAGLRFLTRSKGKPLLQKELLRGAFGTFLFSYLLFYIFQYTGIPLFPLYQVRVLDLKDSAISLGNALFYLVMLMISLRLSHIITKYGHRKVLVFGALMFCLYPLLLSLAQNATLYWVASLVGGGVWALVSAGLINRLMEIVPEDERPAYMSLHNLTLNLGILIGSLLAPLLSGVFGLQEALVWTAGLRLFAGIMLWIWG